MSKLTLALITSAAVVFGFYFDRWLNRPIVMETRCRHGVSYEAVSPAPTLHPYVGGDGASCTPPWNLCQKTA